MIAPTGSDLRRFRKAAEAARDASRRLELARINVTLDPTAEVLLNVVDGENQGVVATLSGRSVEIAGAPNVVVEIPGLGTLRIRGPVTDYDSVRREADTHNAKLIQIGGRFGTTDLEKLEALHLNAVDLESQSREIASAQSALMSGSTVETLNAELEQLNNRAAAIIADQPSWADAHPNAIDLEAAAAECVQRTRSESLAAWRASQQHSGPWRARSHRATN